MGGTVCRMLVNPVMWLHWEDTRVHMTGVKNQVVFSFQYTHEQMRKIYFYTVAVSLHQDFSLGSPDPMSINLGIV